MSIGISKFKGNLPSTVPSPPKCVTHIADQNELGKNNPKIDVFFFLFSFSFVDSPTKPTAYPTCASHFLHVTFPLH